MYQSETKQPGQSSDLKRGGQGQCAPRRMDAILTVAGLAPKRSAVDGLPLGLADERNLVALLVLPDQRFLGGRPLAAVDAVRRDGIRACSEDRRSKREEEGGGGSGVHAWTSVMGAEPKLTAKACEVAIKLSTT